MTGRYTSEKYFVYFLERLIFWCMNGANTYRVLNIITFISTCFYHYLIKQELLISKCSGRRGSLDITIPAGHLLVQVRCRIFVQQVSFRTTKQYTWIFELSYYGVRSQKEAPDILDECIVRLINMIDFKSKIRLRITNISVASTGNTACLIVRTQHKPIRTFVDFQVFKSIGNMNRYSYMLPLCTI